MKRKLWIPRVQTWVGLERLQGMLSVVIELPALRDLMLLYVTSYCFLLRLPSEGLALAAHAEPMGSKVQVPVFSIVQGRKKHVNVNFSAQNMTIWYHEARMMDYARMRCFPVAPRRQVVSY